MPRLLHKTGFFVRSMKNRIAGFFPQPDPGSGTSPSIWRRMASQAAASHLSLKPPPRAHPLPRTGGSAIFGKRGSCAQPPFFWRSVSTSNRVS